MGYYDRDTEFYLRWEEISRDPRLLEEWLREWADETPSREAYIEKLGRAQLEALQPVPQHSEPVNYGRYR
jgi:glutaconate CoA-transferase subunit A